jgi:MFS family permease
MYQAMGATTFGYDAAFLGTTLARKSFKDVSGLPPRIVHVLVLYPFNLHYSLCDVAEGPCRLLPTRCIAPAGLRYRTHHPLTSRSFQHFGITSAYLAAAFFGALFAWPLMETLGRKPTLQVASVIFLVGAVIMTAAESLLSMICECHSVRFA